MRTPLRRIDNKMPLVAIFEERIDTQHGDIGRLRARRSLLARTLMDVKALVQSGRLKRARLAMGVLDALAPDYPPARRVRKALEST